MERPEPQQTNALRAGKPDAGQGKQRRSARAVTIQWIDDTHRATTVPNNAAIRLSMQFLDEGCSHAEQYRRWINDILTRRSERLKEMVRWMDHFEAPKEVPIHTVTLDVDSLDVTRWWRNFFVELGVLTKHDRVFKDLRCSSRTWGVPKPTHQRVLFCISLYQESIFCNWQLTFKCLTLSLPFFSRLVISESYQSAAVVFGSTLQQRTGA